MTVTRTDLTSCRSDDAIAELHETVATQNAAFARDLRPTVAARKERLHALISGILAHEQEMRDALDAEFAVHPELASDLIGRGESWKDLHAR